MNYAGIDHHRQYSHITLLDEKGEVVKSGRVINLLREMEEFLQGKFVRISFLAEPLCGRVVASVFPFNHREEV